MRREVDTSVWRHPDYPAYEPEVRRGHDGWEWRAFPTGPKGGIKEGTARTKRQAERAARRVCKQLNEQARRRLVVPEDWVKVPW
jgi:hypothetical protein